MEIEQNNNNYEQTQIKTNNWPEESLFQKFKNMFWGKDYNEEEKNFDIQARKETSDVMRETSNNLSWLSTSIGAPPEAITDPFAYARDQIQSNRNIAHGFA